MKIVRRNLILIVTVLCLLFVYLHFFRSPTTDEIPSEVNLPDDDTWNPFGHYHSLDHDVEVTPYMPPAEKKGNYQHVVEIWGKASIGLYLWEHVLKAPLESKLDGVWFYGSTTLDNIKFNFRTGPGVTPEHVPDDMENLVLVLNGMLPEKIEFSKKWLDALKNFDHLKNVAVMLLGNEACHNEWLHPYLKKNGGLVSLVFIVYDSPEVDNELYYQWPLGVATYREFPRITDIEDAVLSSSRPYLCNYLATVYKDSTRESLLNMLKAIPSASECFIKPRMEWLPSETNMTRQVYIDALKDSDLTLHAAGKNAECYRLYEALSYGSLPVVEDAIGIDKGQCSTPFRQLKEYGAPVVFVQDWESVGDILTKEKQLTQEAKHQRRTQLVEWYKGFLEKLKYKFVGVIRKKFFESG